MKIDDAYENVNFNELLFPAMKIDEYIFARVNTWNYLEPFFCYYAWNTSELSFIMLIKHLRRPCECYHCILYDARLQNTYDGELT